MPTDKAKIIALNGDRGHPILRVGRKPTITLAYQATAKHINPIENQFYWNPYLLHDSKLISKEIQKTDKGYQIKATY